MGLEKADRWEAGDWTFVEAADAGGAGVSAWAAVRAAWGGFKMPSLPAGCKLDDICHANKCQHCGCHSGAPPCPPAITNFTTRDLILNEQYSPIILIVGEQEVQSHIHSTGPNTRLPYDNCDGTA